ncbi:hypothetical protein H0H87_004645 [Tephrocybe sp. NHM501043]|nr:hypothetical protein H0H87_004645 [Tephrocybe sp. NHM501043]
MSTQAPVTIRLVLPAEPSYDTDSLSILELASSAPRFTQVLFCLLPILLFLAHKKTAKTPVRRMLSHKSQSGSLTPITLPDSQSKAADASKSTPEVVDEKEKVAHPRGLSFATKITFNHFGSLIKDASKTTARRFSIPVRRMSFAIHHLAPHLTPNHHHIDREADSYFSTKKSVDVAGGKDVGEKAKVDSVSTAVEGASETSITTAPDAETTTVADIVPEETVKGEVAGASASLKKASAFRRAARRASVALKITHRS